MKYIKLLVDEWFKEYEIKEVSEECFNNSPEIEQAGLIVGFKINSPEDLHFKINELTLKGFSEGLE